MIDKTVYGHVPVSRACKACLQEPDQDDGSGRGLIFAWEPCPEQRKAAQLVRLGYAALPASQAEAEAILADLKPGAA